MFTRYNFLKISRCFSSDTTKNLQCILNFSRLSTSLGWFGVIHGSRKNIIITDFDTFNTHTIPFNVNNITPLFLSRMAWDLGIESPSGLSSKNSNERELGFYLYLVDIFENEGYDTKETMDKIWSEMIKFDAVVKL